MNLDTYLSLHTKIDSKWIVDLNIRWKIAQFLENSRKSHDLEFYEFLYMTSKA